jgi:integrase
VNAWGPYRPPTWRQPVGWGALHETPPIVTAPVVRESPANWLFNGLLRPAWAYRLELVLIALVAAAYLWLGDRVGRAGAERLIVAATFLVAMVTWTREPLAHALFRSHLRRRWALACRHAELTTPNDRIPRITRCRLTRAGEQLRVRAAGLPEGLRLYDLRHTCASLLIAQGASVKAVQAQLGHATASITLDTYGHLFPSELEALADRLERARATALGGRARTQRGPEVVTLTEAAGR